MVTAVICEFSKKTMYIAIPLSLFGISFLSVLIIILRKRSYLNKVYTLNTAGENNELRVPAGFSVSELAADLFPELASFWDRVGFGKYKSLWLVEAEKILRKTRVLFLRIDRLSDSMIKKIRKIHLNDKLNNPTARDSVAITVEPAVNVTLASAPARAIQDESISKNYLKNEEKRLILDIAKDPKNPKLYETLGDLCLEMGNYSDAKESYEAAIELDPQNDSLKQKLSTALAKIISQS